MFELPLLGKNEKSLKSLILEVLMNSKTLNVMKIKNILSKNFNQKVTYQAVYKAVKEMKRDGILTKIASEYIISEDYIDNLEKYVSLLRKSKKSGFNIFEKKETEKIQFENLFEFYEFLINALSLKYFTDEYKENYFWTTHIWPLSGSVKPKKDVLHRWMKESKTYAIVSKNSLVDKIFGFYSKKRFDMKIKLGIKSNPGFELVVINDTVVQVFLPKVLLDKLDSFYSNIKKTVSFDVFEQITDISFIEAPISVVIIRSKTIADQYKKEIKRYF
ncbi:hypothetical protein H8D36_01880 [archaeon]|nr:hypothetical protein [archaeon]MBL7057536.1 hypothetical protein [Candidatus Woesearchaeota archaeon]